MSRACTICIHPKRKNIESALAAGKSYRDIAGQFAVSKTAVERHAKDHIAAKIQATRDDRDSIDAQAFIAQVRLIEADARRLAKTAEDAGDLKTALAGIRELLRCIELMGKLAGSIDKAPQVNVLVMPEWVELRTAILTAVAAHPAARAAIVAAIGGAV